MWSNMLLRTEALGNIMERHNIYRPFGAWKRDNLRGSTWRFDWAGDNLFTVYDFADLYRIRKSTIIEEAVDLGVSEMRKFWKSFSFIFKGNHRLHNGLLPCMSGFAIPEILKRKHHAYRQYYWTIFETWVTIWFVACHNDFVLYLRFAVDCQ